MNDANNQSGNTGAQAFNVIHTTANVELTVSPAIASVKPIAIELPEPETPFTVTNNQVHDSIMAQCGVVSGFHGETEQDILRTACADWREHRVYIDNAGNYKIKSTKKFAPWNKFVKSRFADVNEFNRHANGSAPGNGWSKPSRAAFHFHRKNPDREYAGCAEQLWPLADKIAGEVAARINRDCPASFGRVTYARQHTLETVIQLLQAKV